MTRWTDEDLASFRASEAVDRAAGIESYGVPGMGSHNGSPPSTGLVFVSAADLIATVPPEPDWIVGGYLAAGNVTLLGGRPKIGKSQFSHDLTDAVAGGAESFLGRRVKSGPVIYISEEGATTLAHKLTDSDRVRILTRDNAWPKPEWQALIEEAMTQAERVSAVLLVIDTIPYWAALPPEREKDSGAALQVMEGCIAAARAGLAVLAQAHTRKGGGEDGEGIRGSSAFAGSADVILELERVKDAPRQRALLALSRYPQTPGTLVVELDASGTWLVVDESAERSDSETIAKRQRDATDRARIMAALEEGSGLTRVDLETATGAPSRQWHSILDELVKTGIVHKSGAGKKGDPHRFEIVRTNAAQGGAQNGAESPDAEILLSALPYMGAETESNAAASLNGPQCAESGGGAPPARPASVRSAETRQPGARRLADLSDAELKAAFPGSMFISEALADATSAGTWDSTTSRPEAA